MVRKAAVVMSGGIRTLEHCYKSLEVCLKDNDISYDVYAAFVSEDVEEIKKAIEITNPVSYVTLPKVNFSKYFDVYDTMGRKFGFSVSYPMSFSNYVANSLRQKQNKKYDLVIRTRPDLLFNYIMIRNNGNKSINIPSRASWGNVCDQFAYGKPEAMDIYFNWWNWLRRMNPIKMKNKYHGTKKMGIKITDKEFFLSPEFLLKEYLSYMRIDVVRTDIDFKILRNCHINTPYSEIPIDNQRFKGEEV